jgi:glycine cleavage system H protein
MKNTWGKELVFPEDVYYSEELLWAKDLGGDRVQLGICDLGVKSVKKLIYVKISCKRGNQITKGESLGFVETTKMVWDIIVPLSGTVVEVNPLALKGNPNPIADDPYGKGWLVELETAGDSGSELAALMKGSDEETKKWILEKAQEIVPLQHEEE